MPPFTPPKPWAPSKEQAAQQEYLNNARKWANAVMRANERGQLSNYVGRSYSMDIPLQFAGDSRYNLRKNGFVGKPPSDDESAIV